MQWKSTKLATLVILMAIGLSGCHKKVVVNTPAGVSSTEVGNWYEVVGANQAISHSAKQLTDLAISLHNQFPSESSYQTTLAALGKLDVVGLQATAYLETVPQNWNQPTATKIGGYLDQLLAQLQIATTSGLDGVKDPTTKAAVNALLQSIRTALQLQVSLVQSQGVTVNGSK